MTLIQKKPSNNIKTRQKGSVMMPGFHVESFCFAYKLQGNRNPHVRGLLPSDPEAPTQSPCLFDWHIWLSDWESERGGILKRDFRVLMCRPELLKEWSLMASKDSSWLLGPIILYVKHMFSNLSQEILKPWTAVMKLDSPHHWTW